MAYLMTNRPPHVWYWWVHNEICGDPAVTFNDTLGFLMGVREDDNMGPSLGTMRLTTVR